MKPDEWELAGWRYFSKVERSSYGEDPPKKRKKRENTHKKREKRAQNIDFDFGKMILII